MRNEGSTKDSLIPRDEFRELLKIHEPYCVSLYIPTAWVNEDKNSSHAQLKLKNLLNELQDEMQALGLKTIEIKEYLSAVDNLLFDHNFWRKQSDCLVVFLSDQILKIYSLPIRCEDFIYISDHFYVLPILPLLDNDARFFLLVLSLNSVILYECTKYSISEMITEDIPAEKPGKVAGYDRSGKPVHADPEQVSGKVGKNNEIEQFIRTADKVIGHVIKNDNKPLVLACEDYFVSLFLKISSYPVILDKHIEGNHEKTDPLNLHKYAWPLLEKFFQKDKETAAHQIRKLSATGKTSFDLNDIVTAAVDGRIEVLFLRPSKDRYGLYDSVNRSLIIDEHYTPLHSSLFNLAAVQTWLRGGKVHLAKEDEMPFKGTGINALFR